MKDVRYESLVLPGGPRLAVATLPHSACASFGVFLPVGSRHDPPGKEGLAHFVEHMLFKGTTRRTPREIATEIEGGGGNVNACTTEDYTAYEARGEAGLLPLMADVLCDMVWHSQFAEAEVELEREVIREEIAMYRESPADHIGDLLAAALWPVHPLGHPVSGYNESTNRIRRTDFPEFSNIHHRRSDLVIAAAGPFPATEVAELLQHHIGGISFAAAPPSADAPQPGKPKAIAERRHTDQLQLALGFRTPGRRDPSRHALRLLSLLLGETTGSRLFQELREQRGLCYQIATDFALFDEAGSFEIIVGLDPRDCTEALDRIWQELDDLAQHGPSDEELARAKRYALGQSTLAFEATGTHLAWVAESLLQHDRIIEPAEARRDLEAVVAQEIQQLADSIFDRDSHARAEIQPG